MNILESQKIKLKTKRAFLKKGTCSRTFLFLLNREFGYPMKEEEQSVDLLAGGILQQGYQCGMLWGAAMAIGAESYRRCSDSNKATGLTILATRHILESFINRTKSADCEDITNCDFSNKWSFAKYFVTGKFLGCFKLAEKWAPEAIKAANEGLNLDQTSITEKPTSCASEVAKRMGATDAETVMVSGFAGGLGLSGNGCGALSAAICMSTLNQIKKGTWKASLSNPHTEKLLNRFYEVTEYEMECHKICGKRFKDIDEHSKFIINGGCDKLITALSQP